MHATLCQLSEHGATPAVAARPIHAHLLIELAKHLLDCLAGESAAFLAGEQWGISGCSGSVLSYVLGNFLPQLLAHNSLLSLCAFGLPAL
jgi:hypothetical protein